MTLYNCRLCRGNGFQRDRDEQKMVTCPECDGAKQLHYNEQPYYEFKPKYPLNIIGLKRYKGPDNAEKS